MKKLNLNFLWAILIGVALVTGCKKDDNSGQDTTKPVVPTVAKNAEVVKIPAAMENSSNTYVSIVSGYATLVNSFSQMSTIFANIPANAQQSQLKSSGTVWTWSDNAGNAVWIEQIEGTDNYTWKYYYKETGMTDRFLVMTATELKSGLGGSLVIYDPDQPSTTATVNYQWSKNSAGEVSATLLFYDDQDSMFFAITSKPDTSGTLKIYNGTSASGVLFANFAWTSAGTGTWWFKDVDSGQIQQGTF